MTITKSRFCVRCDAQFQYQCECPNNIRAAWARANIFHIGKRYRGKEAWEKTHPDQEYIKSDTNQ